MRQHLFGALIGAALLTSVSASWAQDTTIPKHLQLAREFAANTTDSCGTSAMRCRTACGDTDLIGTPS